MFVCTRVWGGTASNKHKLFRGVALHGRGGVGFGLCPREAAVSVTTSSTYVITARSTGTSRTSKDAHNGAVRAPIETRLTVRRNSQWNRSQS